MSPGDHSNQGNFAHENQEQRKRHRLTREVQHARDHGDDQESQTLLHHADPVTPSDTPDSHALGSNDESECKPACTRLQEVEHYSKDDREEERAANQVLAHERPSIEQDQRGNRHREVNQQVGHRPLLGGEHPQRDEGKDYPGTHSSRIHSLHSHRNRQCSKPDSKAEDTPPGIRQFVEQNSHGQEEPDHRDRETLTNGPTIAKVLLHERCLADGLADDSILVEQHHQDQPDAADQRDVRLNAVAHRIEHPAVESTAEQSATKYGAADVADAADHRVGDELNGAEVVVVAETDGGVSECVQHATHRSNARRNTKRVQLCTLHVDAEGGCGAFIRANCQEPSSGSTTAQVAHNDDHQQQEGEHDDHVIERIRRRPDIPAEDLRLRNDRSLGTAGEVRVVEDRHVKHRAQAQGDNGQVNSTSAYRRNCKEESQRNCRDNTDKQHHEEWPALVCGNSAGNPRSENTDRELCERELARVAGQHDDREHHDARCHGDDESVEPDVLHGERHRNNHDHGGSDQWPAQAAVAHRGELLQDEVA